MDVITDAGYPTGGDSTSPKGMNESKNFNAHLTFNSQQAREDKGVDKLRSKLIEVGQRFVGFDKIVEEETVKRKGLEKQRIAQVQEGLLKLEKALNLEIKRRVDANKTVQQMTDQLANGMLERLQTMILQRIEKLAGSIESLTLRCSALEKGISQFKGDMPSKIEVDTASLVKEISGLRQQMEQDKKERIQRDAAYLKRITEVEYGTDSKFESGFATLTQQTDAIKKDIASLSRTDDSSEEQFRAFLLEEVAALKNTLAMASQGREQTDDEIVQAINQYTNALQKGLESANHR